MSNCARIHWWDFSFCGLNCGIDVFCVFSGFQPLKERNSAPQNDSFAWIIFREFQPLNGCRGEIRNGSTWVQQCNFTVFARIYILYNTVDGSDIRRSPLDNTAKNGIDSQPQLVGLPFNNMAFPGVFLMTKCHTIEISLPRSFFRPTTPSGRGPFWWQAFKRKGFAFVSRCNFFFVK